MNNLNTCPKCNSTNLVYQPINEVKLKAKHKSCLYWLIIGWWLEPILWICCTLPMLIITIFKPKNYKTVNKAKTICVCQNCGYSWKV